jgi:hypothetical protein
MQTSPMKPRMPVRRFDVFAEYSRLKGLETLRHMESCE